MQKEEGDGFRLCVGLPYKKEEHAAINERSCNVKNWLVVEIVVVIVYMSLFTFMSNILSRRLYC